MYKKCSKVKKISVPHGQTTQGQIEAKWPHSTQQRTLTDTLNNVFILTHP